MNTSFSIQPPNTAKLTREISKIEITLTSKCCENLTSYIKTEKQKEKIHTNENADDREKRGTAFSIDSFTTQSTIIASPRQHMFMEFKTSLPSVTTRRLIGSTKIGSWS